MDKIKTIYDEWIINGCRKLIKMRSGKMVQTAVILEWQGRRSAGNSSNKGSPVHYRVKRKPTPTDAGPN
jgi:hypothetical protein